MLLPATPVASAAPPDAAVGSRGLSGNQVPALSEELLPPCLCSELLELVMKPDRADWWAQDQARLDALATLIKESLPRCSPTQNVR